MFASKKVSDVDQIKGISEIDNQSAESLVGGQGFAVGRFSSISGRNLGNTYTPTRSLRVNTDDVFRVNVTNHAGHRARFITRHESRDGQRGETQIFELDPGDTTNVGLLEDLPVFEVTQRDPIHFNINQHRSLHRGEFGGEL